MNGPFDKQLQRRELSPLFELRVEERDGFVLRSREQRPSGRLLRAVRLDGDLWPAWMNPGVAPEAQSVLRAMSPSEVRRRNDAREGGL